MTTGLGAIDVSQPEPAEAVSAAAGSTVADFAFDFSGSAVAINQTVSIVHNGGVVVLEGAGPPAHNSWLIRRN